MNNTTKVQIISADKVPALLEDILRVRNPELAATRAKNRKRTRDRARNWKGTRITLTPDMSTAELSLVMLQAMQTKQPEPQPPGAYLIGSTRRTFANITDLNRDLNETRWKRYAKSMLDGSWILTSDAIAITNEGLVINGQHRLAAAQWIATQHPDLDPMPQFIVAWGIDPRAAHLMDEAKRSPEDRRTIAMRAATIERTSA